MDLLKINFWPISLLSIKILEKLIHNRLSGFLDNNNILYKHQFRFRKDNSRVHSYKLQKKSENQLMKVNLGVEFLLI